MHKIYRFHGFLRKIVHFPSTISVHPIHHCGCFVKGIHSLNQFKQKKSFTPFQRNNAKPMKSFKKDDIDPKEYMRDTVSKVYRILKFSTWDSAKQQLEELPTRWDSYTVNQVLKTHPPMEKAWLFFNWASGLRGFKHDQYTYTTMLDIFGEAGRISSMKYVFQQMQVKGIKIDSATYTSLMHWLSNSGNVDEAVKMWEEMNSKGCCPTVVSYSAYMKILFNNGKVKEATDVYKEMLQSGCTPNCYTYTILMEYLIGSGKCKEALEIFEGMQETGVQPDKAACNILIERSCGVGGTAAITQILQYMKQNRLVLRYPVYMKAMATLKVAGESDALLRQVHPQFSMRCFTNEEANDCVAVATDSPVDTDKGLLYVFLKRRNLVAIDFLLTGVMDKKIPLDHDVISAIIKENCNCCRPEGALLAFEYRVKLGICIERTAYLALIGLLTRSNLFPKLVEVVEEMNRAGYSLGIFLASLLIYRVGSARRPSFATKLFNLLPDDHKCTATYTALISVYFFAGSVSKALEIFKIMRTKGFAPALGTYDVLIAGLERSSRSSEADAFRREKKSLYANCYPQGSVCMKQKICDLLFAVNVVS